MQNNPKIKTLTNPANRSKGQRPRPQNQRPQLPEIINAGAATTAVEASVIALVLEACPGWEARKTAGGSGHYVFGNPGQRKQVTISLPANATPAQVRMEADEIIFILRRNALSKAAPVTRTFQQPKAATT